MKEGKFKKEVSGRELVAEIRNLAEQANGSCLLRYGDTMVLATCVMSKENRENQDFFPLMVEYEERYYAAGKIKGSRFIKREGRPSDEAILNARLIDRPIRPRFPTGLAREVQIVVTVLSWDSQNDPDILGVMATSIALSISDIPWAGPLAAVRVCKKDGQLILNPTYEQREKSEIDIVFTGIQSDNGILINMIEGEFQEVEESLVIEAEAFAEAHLKELINFQKEIAKQVGKEKIIIQPSLEDPETEREIKNFLGKSLENAIYRKDKSERMEAVDRTKEELAEFMEEKYPGMGKTRLANAVFEKEVERIIHENAIKFEKRPDGRKIDEIRSLSCEAGLLPRTHGSGLFCRGETKALSILTLGAPGDKQLLEGMEMTGSKRFMHHYNFPPYSTGEIKPMRGPGRRDIGHGMLAERALLPLIPSFESFPYTIRIVSEIVSSNGSTSMASVSSSSLALMDAGVPIIRPATGISLGLMIDNQKNYKILTDIQGPEDHHGDMDFKIAGTRKGITAIQMDVKIEGITKEIMAETLERGKRARNQILDEIEKVLAEPRPQLSPFAPKILTIQINPDKIREVVGPGGKVINEIIDKTGATIDIQQSGMIFVTSESEEAAQKAVEWIKNITREVQVGEIFEGKVTRIFPFGAMVEIFPGQEGLIHISQLAFRRVDKVEDVVHVGDVVPVKVISIDEQGRVNLSLKEAKNHGG